MKGNKHITVGVLLPAAAILAYLSNGEPASAQSSRIVTAGRGVTNARGQAFGSSLRNLIGAGPLSTGLGPVGALGSALGGNPNALAALRFRGNVPGLFFNPATRRFNNFGGPLQPSLNALSPFASGQGSTFSGVNGAFIPLNAGVAQPNTIVSSGGPGFGGGSGDLFFGQNAGGVNDGVFDQAPGDPANAGELPRMSDTIEARTEKIDGRPVIHLMWRGEPRLVNRILFAVLDANRKPLEERKITRLPADARFFMDKKDRKPAFYEVVVEYLNGATNRVLSPL